MKRGSRPAFGVVGAPDATAVARGGVGQAADGFVPRQGMRTDRAAPDPVLDACADATRHGDWRAVAAAMPPLDADPDVHQRIVAGVGELAVEDDAWLNAWLDAAPADANAWCVHAQAMMRLAWRLRTGAPAADVLPEQWVGFRRVLGQAPAAAERAVALAPGLATPWIVLMSCAQGLGWEHDRFRAIWAEVSARAPVSVAAHQRALYYWLPRWQGSAELATAFVADTSARARPGSLLTGVRLEYLFLEDGPGLAEALDAAIADLAAAPADHPYRILHRHWLAYLLTRAGRPTGAAAGLQRIPAIVGRPPGRQ